MKETISLCALPGGEKAYVTHICDACPIKGRLTDLGFTQGARVCALYCDGAGCLRAYEVCGAVIALRAEDARYVEVSL